jgi:hypothetical protein
MGSWNDEPAVSTAQAVSFNAFCANLPLGIFINVKLALLMLTIAGSIGLSISLYNSIYRFTSILICGLFSIYIDLY